MSMAKKSAKKSIRGSREQGQATSYAHAKNSKKGSQEHGQAPSYAEACNTAVKGMKDHGKAPRTKNYDGHVRR
jgi:hypothetical protein